MLLAKVSEPLAAWIPDVGRFYVRLANTFQLNAFSSLKYPNVRKHHGE
jgi:hypothetical protein